MNEELGAAAWSAPPDRVTGALASGQAGVSAHQCLKSCYYLCVALPFLELCSINNSYDGD